MTSSDSTHWREKYLQALDDNERLQRENADYIENLRKTLVRVSLASDGIDPELDAAMARLRSVLRKEGREGLGRAMAEAETTILKVEKRRSAGQAALQDTLIKLGAGASQAVTGEAQKRLKRLVGNASAAAESPAHLQTWLAELSALLACEPVAESTGKGFFQRWFSRTDDVAPIAVVPEVTESDSATGRATPADAALQEAELTSEPQAHALPESALPDTVLSEPVVSETVVSRPEPLEPELIASELTESELTAPEPAFEPRPHSAGEIVNIAAEPPLSAETAAAAAAAARLKPATAILEGQVQTRAEVEQEGPEAVFERPLHEPAFSRISDKILRILVDLLDNIEPVPCVETKAIAARLRIAKGLNWFELVPTLEDIRDILMQAFLAADQEFGEYLLQVDRALADISAALGLVLADRVREQAQQQAFETVVNQQVEAIGVTVTEADNLEQLKQQVSEHIVCIRDALARRSNSAEDEQPLARQLAELAAQVRSMEDEARSVRADLEIQRQKALQDPLTQLPNREAYSERVHQEFSRWQRYGRPLTLAVCDIDFFKRINDNFGHQAGDRVLQVLGRGIAKRLRDVDFMARYGGEEFVLVLPETTGDQAQLMLDKIRDGIAQTPFHFKEKPVRITLSMGIAEFSGDDSIESVFARADARLYQAKALGRNRCINSDAPEAGQSA